MKIDKLIERLQQLQARHGNIEVTTTHCLAQQANPGDGEYHRRVMKGYPYETTVENVEFWPPGYNGIEFPRVQVLL